MGTNDIMLGVTLRWTSIPSSREESSNTPSYFILKKLGALCDLIIFKFTHALTALYYHLLKSSFISSTLDGWQQTANEDCAGSNSGATYVFATLIRSARVTWEILANKDLQKEQNN